MWATSTDVVHKNIYFVSVLCEPSDRYTKGSLVARIISEEEHQKRVKLLACVTSIIGVENARTPVHTCYIVVRRLKRFIGCAEPGLFERELVDVKEELWCRGPDGAVLPGGFENDDAAKYLTGKLACIENTPHGG